MKEDRKHQLQMIRCSGGDGGDNRTGEGKGEEEGKERSF